MLNKEIRAIKVTDSWSGQALIDTTSHILEYRKNRDSEYFSKYLYIPFLTLINYHILRLESSSPQFANEHDDWINECFLMLQTAIEKYDETKSAYSFFGTCIKNDICRQFNKKFAKMRDIRKEIHLDAIPDEYNKNAYEPSYEQPEFVDSENEYYLSKINKFTKFLKYYKKRGEKGIYMTRYLDLIDTLLSGSVVIPSDDTSHRDLCSWLKEKSNLKSNAQISKCKTRVRREFDFWLMSQKDEDNKNFLIKKRNPVKKKKLSYSKRLVRKRWMEQNPNYYKDYYIKHKNRKTKTDYSNCTEKDGYWELACRTCGKTTKYKNKNTAHVSNRVYWPYCALCKFIHNPVKCGIIQL